MYAIVFKTVLRFGRFSKISEQLARVNDVLCQYSATTDQEIRENPEMKKDGVVSSDHAHLMLIILQYVCKYK